MKIAICFRGVFGIRSILSKEKSISEITSCFEKTIENNKKLFLNEFIIPENKVDYFFSTYSVNEGLDSYIAKKFNPIAYSFLDKKFMTYPDTWRPQFAQFKNLVDLVDEIQYFKRENYDLLIFTRQDIKYQLGYDSVDVDLDKFNIVFRHTSGNCDDGLWIFPIKYFEKFKKSIYELSSRSYAITHEINHLLEEMDVEINYMSEPDNGKTDVGCPFYTKNLLLNE